TIDSQEMNTEQTMGFGLSFTATETDPEGNVWVDVQYEWVQFKQNNATGETEYDSRNPSDETIPSLIGIDALVGKGYSMKVSPSGEILKIAGIETMISELLKDLDTKDEALVTQMEESFKKQYSEEALKEQAGNMIVEFPEGAVQIGDTWASRVSSTSLVPLAAETTYTLLAYEEGIATIGMKSMISSVPEKSETDLGLYKIRYNLSGTQEGTIAVDTAVGWSASSTITQTVAGEMVLVMDKEETTVPILLVSIVTVEMEKK
ncbi:MAG TPA: DUF6263 family protein, partial [Candidatus Nitrosotenuis sp.]|nr:DUF6263 family protein [Candidatus Nitrosotenuis sp.]